MTVLTRAIGFTSQQVNLDLDLVHMMADPNNSNRR